MPAVEADFAVAPGITHDLYALVVQPLHDDGLEQFVLDRQPKPGVAGVIAHMPRRSPCRFQTLDKFVGQPADNLVAIGIEPARAVFKELRRDMAAEKAATLD